MSQQPKLYRILEKSIVFFKKFRIIISPYYVFCERISRNISPNTEEDFEEYSICHLDVNDMKIIAEIPGRNIPEKELIERLKRGNVCLGVKHKDNIVAFSWYDLEKSNIKGRIGQLKEDEAYLFDMYALPSQRGKGLAPYLRYQSYRELEKLGRKKLYSFSDYFNMPAIRFKEKLNAKKTELRLMVRFKRWRINMRLKKYADFGV